MTVEIQVPFVQQAQQCNGVKSVHFSVLQNILECSHVLYLISNGLKCGEHYTQFDLKIPYEMS